MQTTDEEEKTQPLGNWLRQNRLSRYPIENQTTYRV